MRHRQWFHLRKQEQREQGRRQRQQAVQGEFAPAPGVVAAPIQRLGERLGALALNRYPDGRVNDLRAALADYASADELRTLMRAHRWPLLAIGLGSGACAAIAAKLALGRQTRIVGVVSSHATTYADSLAAGHVVEAPVTTQLADGMACRVADAAALAIIAPHIDHIVQVSDNEVAAAMRALFTDTHNVAEGAGAAAFAAALQEKDRLAGQTVGVALTGGNVDADIFSQVLRPAP